jgi:hypothetical protein
MALLRLQPAGRQQDLLGSPGDAIQFRPDAQPVQLVPGELDRALLTRQVPHLDRVSQLEQAAGHNARVVVPVDDLGRQHANILQSPARYTSCWMIISGA